MAFYQNELRRMLTEPDSFKGTPGFQFALDRGTDQINRRLSSMGLNNSGKQLQDLAEFSTGLAMQDWGNQVDRLGRLDAQDKNFALGAYQAGNSYDLGNRGLAQSRLGMDREYGLSQDRMDMDRARLGYDLNQADENADLAWYNAGTSRGNALKNWLKPDEYQMLRRNQLKG